MSPSSVFVCCQQNVTHYSDAEVAVLEADDYDDDDGDDGDDGVNESHTVAPVQTRDRVRLQISRCRPLQVGMVRKDTVLRDFSTFTLPFFLLTLSLLTLSLLGLLSQLLPHLSISQKSDFDLPSHIECPIYRWFSFPFPCRSNAFFFLGTRGLTRVLDPPGLFSTLWPIFGCCQTLARLILFCAEFSTFSAPWILLPRRLRSDLRLTGHPVGFQHFANEGSFGKLYFFAPQCRDRGIGHRCAQSDVVLLSFPWSRRWWKNMVDGSVTWCFWCFSSSLRNKLSEGISLIHFMFFHVLLQVVFPYFT